MIIDTHAHLIDESLSSNIDQVLAEARSVDVSRILCVATQLDSTRRSIDMARQYEMLRASAGIHPNYCAAAPDSDWNEIEHLAENPLVVAIGETGLDRYWQDSPWDRQVEVFRKHIQLSRNLDKPLIIHTRECAEETLDLLRSEYQIGPFRAVMHSFTGPQSVADGCLELGLFISFAGMLTYKNAEDIRQIAATIPSDRILVETDCPYLTPHPHRGKRPNKPSYVIHTLQCLADVRRVPVAALAEQTTRNALTLFHRW